MFAHVTIKECPFLRAALKKAFPSYRKHKATIRRGSTVTPTGTYWDGGSRDSYYFVTPYGHVEPVGGQYRNPPQFGGGRPEPQAIPSGSFAVRLGIFRGKTSRATIFLPETGENALGTLIAEVESNLVEERY